MGDIIHKIEVCGITGDGTPKKCVVANAIVDTGATTTVISPALSANVQAGRTQTKATIEGRKVPVDLTMMKLQARGCDYSIVAAAVDEKISARAGEVDGKRIDVILGHDYLQRRQAVLAYGDRTEKHSVTCRGGRRGR